MDTSEAVVTDGLTKRYGERVAVDRLAMTVRRGEVYGFLGPNAAGKTTTLRMLVGLVRPSAGRASVLGRAPGDPAALARTGILVEGPGLYPYLSGRDNLRVLARLASVPEARVAIVLADVDLADRAGDRFSSYSLGMKQRLGVAAALLKDPELLLLDEPTNGLDPAGTADMRVLIRRLADGGRTVLLSSHLLTEVAHVCDRVGIVAGGRLVAESTVDALRGDAGVVVRAEPVARAAEVAARLAGPAAVRVDGGLVHVTPPQVWPGVPALTVALVAAGVDVHEIRATERSLEDVFLALTDSSKKLTRAR